MNRKSIRVTTEPVNIVAGVPVGTSVVIQNTGSAVVCLFEGPVAELDSDAPTSELVGYPGFHARSSAVTSDPIWAWCNKGSSVPRRVLVNR